MENLDQNLAEPNAAATNEIRATRLLRQRWYTISRWALFLGIAGFVLSVLLLLGIWRMATNLPSAIEYALGDSPVMDALESLSAGTIGIFIFLIAFQLLVHYWQMRFALQMKRAITYTDQEAFESSWLNLRNFFRAIGIAALIFGVLFFVGLLVMMFSMLN